MENQETALIKRQGQDTKKASEPIVLNPHFEDLRKPETLLNHVQKLTKTTTTPPDAILNKLLQQFEPLDFEELANPNNAENFRLSNKHFTVLSIENVFKIAENNRWGLCKNHDFIYLYNGTFWDELDKETFQKFLGEAAEKKVVPNI